MKKIISILLATFTLFCCFSCSANNNKTSSSTEDAKVDEVLTSEYVLKNGKTEYAIVLPENSNNYEETAASELALLFYEATGISLSTIRNDELTHNDTAQYFSIGNTSLLETANIEIDKKAEGKNAYQITTKGKTIYFIGGRENGVLYGVYEFLFRTLNFEQFSEDCYSLDKAVTEIPLYDYSVVDYPSFPDHLAFSGYMNRNRGVMHRMRGGSTYSGDQMSIEGWVGHNTLIFIKKSEHLAEHEKWFSYPDQSQLCYVAQGDEAEYELLVDAMFERVKETIMLDYNRGRKTLYIDIMDNKSCCNCKKCTELREHYGCNTAQMIWFLNDVDDKLQNWFKNDELGKTYYDPSFMLQVSFYEQYTDSPVVYNESKKQWEPMDESVVFNKTVRPTIAPINANYQKPITDPVNSTYYEAVQKIAAISQQFGVFWYSTNFHGYLYPFDTYSAMQSSYQTLYEMGCSRLVDETQNGNDFGMTGFHMFKSYLSTALAWDVYADQNALTERFFKGYFMDAADDMRKFYESYRNFSQIQMNGLCPNIGGIFYAIGKKEYWPKAVIDEWQGYVALAMEKIEKYKTTDLETYEMLYKHISMERVFLDYCYLQFYKVNLGADFAFYRDRFIADFRLNNITKTKEGNYPLEAYAQTLMAD